MIGKLRDMTINRDGTTNITVTVAEDFSEAFDGLRDFPVDVDIKRHRNRRSLSSNNYAWELIDRLAEKLHQPKTDVYREAIRDLGGISVYLGIREEAVEKFTRSWTKDHLGRQVEVIPGSEKPGWVNVRVYYGSSEFDTAQMSRFLDNLIQDAEAQGIPTISPEEEQRMIRRAKR